MMTTAASVTLLFNNNLSPRLPRLLADLYPGSLHLKDLDMRGSGDSRVWEYAKDHGFAIVTKDRDYKDMSGDPGHPPKVVLITLPNCLREDVEALLRDRCADVVALLQDDRRGLLELP